MIDLRTRGESGFVLVIVLALLVVLALLATATATSAERAIQAAQEDADRFESELAMAGTRACWPYCQRAGNSCLRQHS